LTAALSCARDDSLVAVFSLDIIQEKKMKDSRKIQQDDDKKIQRKIRRMVGEITYSD